MAFLATAADPVSQPDGEAAELRWCRAETLPTPIFGPDTPVLRDYVEHVDSVVIG